MAYAGFYNLNANITYPFVTTGTDRFNFVTGGEMPNDLVLDCGFTVGPRPAYNPEVGAVYLHSLTRNGNNLEFRFRVRPNDGTEREFLFVRDKDAAIGLTNYAEATGGPLYGVAFLVTGNIRAVYDRMYPAEVKELMSYAPPGQLPGYEVIVEPALVVSNYRQAALTVSVGNMLRLSDQPCGDCGVPVPVDDKTVKLQAGAQNMVGRVRLLPGYNLAAAVSPADNTITLNAVVGEGKGEVCGNDVIRYDGDVPGQGARCADFIYTIDGVPPNAAGAFQLEGGGAFFIKPMTAGLITIDSKVGTTVVCE
jgi:hypothetical protein